MSKRTALAVAMMAPFILCSLLSLVYVGWKVGVDDPASQSHGDQARLIGIQSARSSGASAFTADSSVNHQVATVPRGGLPPAYDDLASYRVVAAHAPTASKQQLSGQTASDFIKAVTDNDIGKARLLLQANGWLVHLKLNVTVNITGRSQEVKETVLHLAAMRVRVDIVRLLLEAGAEVNVLDDLGRTPFSVLAVEHFSSTPEDIIELIKLLLANGAHVDQYGELAGQFEAEWAWVGGRPLLARVAGDCDHPESSLIDMIRILLAHGAAIDGTTSDGETALHRASAAGHPAVVTFLLENGAKCNAASASGETPLHVLTHPQSQSYPCCFGKLTENMLQIAHALIEHHADVNAVDKKGNTPVDSAKHDEAPEVAEVIEHAGGKG